MIVKIVNESPFDLPNHATAGSAGADLRADLTKPLKFKGMITYTHGDNTILINEKPEREIKSILLWPQARVIIPTGIRIELPNGYEARIQPRSGLSFKTGLTCTLGCIDSDYRGDVGVIVSNFTDKPIEINHGDRVAQMIISKYEPIEWELCEELSETERGEGGFGHTGKQ